MKLVNVSAARRRRAAAEERYLGPTLLLPSIASLFGILLAWAMGVSGIASSAPLEVVSAIQALLTLFGAAVIAGTQAANAGCWRRRVAPSAAARRVRQVLLKMLSRLAARALAGPLVMVASLAWLRPGWDLLGMAAEVLLVLAAALLVGALLGAGLQRRALAWLAAVQRPRSASAWRWKGGWRRWRHVATPHEIATNVRGTTLWMWFLLPQALMQAPQWRFHAWGKTLSSGADLAWAGLWMLLLGLFVNAVVVGPPLHWRARLAPRGSSAAGWARRMVAGSMLNAIAWMSAVMALSMAVSPADVRAVQLSAWAPVMSDVLLAMTWILWMRGLRNNGFAQVLAGLALAMVSVLLLGAVLASGGVPQRGLALLAIEMTLALAFAVAAQRAWSRQDLNRLAQPS